MGKKKQSRTIEKEGAQQVGKEIRRKSSIGYRKKMPKRWQRHLLMGITKNAIVWSKKRDANTLHATFVKRNP